MRSLNAAATSSKGGQVNPTPAKHPNAYGPWAHGLGDQKRTATPLQAIRDGADHIVIGRPIWQAADPAAAARAVIAELR
jgi:hypothetical protein